MAQNQNQRLQLAQLLRSVATSGPEKLAAMQTQIAAALAASATTAGDARTGNSRASEAAELAAASANSRQQVQSVMRDLHRFDPYLSFDSPEAEAEYRRRQADRTGYIEQQHARGTPEGDLNASAGAIGQMTDAQAHGAGESPEFQQRWTELLATTERLRGAVQRSGGSTHEFDERLRAELRQTLRARGIPDAQIESRLAAHPGNPLAAMRDYMRDENDLQSLRRTVGVIGDRAAAPTHVVAADAPAMTMDLDAVMAEFRTTGVVLSETTPGDRFAHGVTINQRPTPARGRADPA